MPKDEIGRQVRMSDKNHNGQKFADTIWWSLYGVMTGTLLGAQNAWLSMRFAPLDPLLTYSIFICLSAGLSAAYTTYRRKFRPEEFDFCTLLGMWLGLVPALFMFIVAAGQLGNIPRLALVAFVPIFIGMFSGGLLDRIAERLLRVKSLEVPSEENSG